MNDLLNWLGDAMNWLKMSFYAVFVWLNIDLEVFTILVIFMSIDSFLGAIKAVRLGYDFSFNRLLWGFLMKLCFLIIPLLVALLGKGVSNQDFSISVDVVMKILIVSEAYSVFGNIYAAKNKIEVKRLDAISLLLKAIRTGLSRLFHNAIGQIERAGDCDLTNKENKDESNTDN